MARKPQALGARKYLWSFDPLGPKCRYGRVVLWFFSRSIKFNDLARLIPDGANVTAFILTPTNQESRGSHLKTRVVDEEFRTRTYGHCLLLPRPQTRQS